MGAGGGGKNGGAFSVEGTGFENFSAVTVWAKASAFADAMKGRKDCGWGDMKGWDVM